MWTDNETTTDLFGFSIHATLIKKIITNKNNLPITMGLYGDWGSGKSTILKIIKEEIERDSHLKENTLVICFDGWIFENYEDERSALMCALVNKIVQSKKFVQQINYKGQQLIDAINFMQSVSLNDHEKKIANNALLQSNPNTEKTKEAFRENKSYSSILGSAE